MATSAEPVDVGLASNEASRELATQWRSLTRAATAVAVLTSPAAFLWFYERSDLSLAWSLFLTFLLVIAFRGFVDVVLRRFIPWPSLFGTDETRAKEEDVLARRRAWYWRKKYRLFAWIVVFLFPIHLARGGWTGNPLETITWAVGGIAGFLGNPAIWVYAVIFPILFLFNFVILFGPLMLMGVTQVQGFEPGDAEWGVKLADVRGQAEAKEEVRRVVSLWQSGEAFEKAGGKRERGLLFLGAPGTGKTMLSKAIATGFNSPFVSIPGSGFQQTFIGMDAVVVRWLAWKAKKLARKWGGTCIVFIDEIDAVGRRRSSLGPAGGADGHSEPTSFEDFCFYGPWGALNPSQDLVLETRAWRERLFAQRAPERRFAAPALVQRLGGIMNQVMPGMFGGGGLALNQLLVVMDGIGNPPFMKRVFTNRVNTFLDATYVLPQRIGPVPLRLPPAKPAAEQIYFIGACNVPLEQLDPALIRPGRMGRHVWFRTPTKKDRLDVFDLYINRVAHEPDLDTPKRRDELARITMGYSPAMIEQVCSMALTHAHHDGRERFRWQDIVEAMTTVESGTAINIEYIPEETRAVAIHEAGHAVAAHVYRQEAESTRLSIRRRGASLGHHMALEKDERFTRWRSQQMAILIWGLGAMAAEQVFYGETSDGVGGDIQSATALAAFMVGASAMGPERIDLSGAKFADETEDETRERLMKQFERLGIQLMNRTSGGGPFAHDPIASVLSDRDKRATAAQILGQAYVKAYNLMEHNREGVERIAEEVIERRELYGDELVELLEAQNLKQPDVDLMDEKTWPKI